MNRYFVIGILVLLAFQSVSASELCLKTTPLYFSDIHVDKVCQSRLPELLNKQLDFLGMMGPLLSPDEQNRTSLNTCNQYLSLSVFGNLESSRLLKEVESAVYMHVCGTLYAVDRAQKPKKSFLGKNPVSLSVLPTTMLPSPTGDVRDEMKMAFEKGQSINDYLLSEKLKNRHFNRKEYLDGWKVVLHARADFDGDGIEDALVSYSYNPPGYHYLEVGMGLLKRLSSNGPAEWVEFNEFPWAEPELKSPDSN